MKKLFQIILQAGTPFLLIAFILTSGCQQQEDYTKELKPLADKYVEVWNGANPDELDSIMSSDYAYHSNQDSVVNGLEGIKKVISSFRTAYPDAKLTIEDEIFSKDKAVSRWVINGTNTGPGQMPPTGKYVKIWGESIINIVNGKLAEEWVAFDQLAIMTQLGYTMMPPAAPEKKK